MDEETYILNSSLTIFVLATVGSVIQIVGAVWDDYSHLIGEPENFVTYFTNAHMVMYTGISIIGIAAAVGGFKMLNHKAVLMNKSFKIAFKILIIAIALVGIAGTFDFWWHETFVFKGLPNPLGVPMVPPHILHTFAMFVSSFGCTLGLSRIISYLPLKGQIIEFFIGPAAVITFLAGSWVIFGIVLPFTNGPQSHFSNQTVFSTIMVVDVLPLIASVTLYYCYIKDKVLVARAPQ